MRYRVLAGFFALCLLLSACGQSAEAAWQEQYDLGVKYLDEGSYEEAVIAFTAAIDIDEKRPEAYIGRGDAYALSGDTEDNLAAAQTDYEAAIALDETMPGGWLGLADVYIRRGDYDRAMEILREALEKTGNDRNIADKLSAMESGSFADSMGHVRHSISYNEQGQITTVYDYTYSASGYQSGWTYVQYDPETGAETDCVSVVVEFDERGFPCKNVYYDTDGQESGTYDRMVFSDEGLELERHKYHSGGGYTMYKYYYDEIGRRTRYEAYRDGKELAFYYEYRYDPETGRALEAICYDAQGNVIGRQEFS